MSKKQNEKNINVDEMSDYQYARWAALYQAINMIDEMAEERKVEFDDLHLDQIAIAKYVDEYADDILYDIIQEKEKTANETYTWF